jgi:hypothetical protein
MFRFAGFFVNRHCLTWLRPQNAYTDRDFTPNHESVRNEQIVLGAGRVTLGCHVDADAVPQEQRQLFEIGQQRGALGSSALLAPMR